MGLDGIGLDRDELKMGRDRDGINLGKGCWEVHQARRWEFGICCLPCCLLSLRLFLGGVEMGWGY